MVDKAQLVTAVKAYLQVPANVPAGQAVDDAAVEKVVGESCFDATPLVYPRLSNGDAAAKCVETLKSADKFKDLFKTKSGDAPKPDSKTDEPTTLSAVLTQVANVLALADDKLDLTGKKAAIDKLAEVAKKICSGGKCADKDSQDTLGNIRDSLGDEKKGPYPAQIGRFNQLITGKADAPDDVPEADDDADADSNDTAPDSAAEKVCSEKWVNICSEPDMIGDDSCAKCLPQVQERQQKGQRGKSPEDVLREKCQKPDFKSQNKERCNAVKPAADKSFGELMHRKFTLGVSVGALLAPTRGLVLKSDLGGVGADDSVSYGLLNTGDTNNDPNASSSGIGGAFLGLSINPSFTFAISDGGVVRVGVDAGIMASKMRHIVLHGANPEYQTAINNNEFTGSKAEMSLIMGGADLVLCLEGRYGGACVTLGLGGAKTYWGNDEKVRTPVVNGATTKDYEMSGMYYDVGAKAFLRAWINESWALSLELGYIHIWSSISQTTNIDGEDRKVGIDLPPDMIAIKLKLEHVFGINF